MLLVPRVYFNIIGDSISGFLYLIREGWEFHIISNTYMCNVVSLTQVILAHDHKDWRQPYSCESKLYEFSTIAMPLGILLAYIGGRLKSYSA